jgi:hypothetical protein
LRNLVQALVRVVKPSFRGQLLQLLQTLETEPVASEGPELPRE